MGGWMDYERMRSRNGLMFRKPEDDPDPYWRHGLPSFATESINRLRLVGDMNRMERDYLTPDYPRHPNAGRIENSDPSAACAKATGVDVEVVRRVLRFVFTGEVDQEGVEQ